MNRIDLFKYPRFPLSSETLEYLQQMAVLTAKLASIGGNNYILSGCDVTGQNVSAGTVVIAGEILPFTGGGIESFIIIEETKRSVTAESQVYQEVYVSRVARFGTGVNQTSWESLKRVPDLITVSTNLNTLAEAFGNHVLNHRVSWSNIDNKPSEFPSAVLKTGSTLVGDISHDKLMTVEFASVKTANYIVAGSLRSAGSNWDEDNDVIWLVKTKTETSFKLLLKEFSTDVQNLYFDWAIIKL